MLAGAHGKRVADAHLLDGHRHLATVTHQRGRLRSQPHEALQRVRRPTLSARLEQLAKRDERKDHGARLEVERMQPRVGVGRAPVHQRGGHGKEADKTVDEGCARS